MHDLRTALLTAAVLMVVAARGLAAADVDPLSPRQILAKQQAYFNSIKSIEFYSTFTMSRSPEMTARMEQEGNPPRTKIEQALHLIIDGDKFRAEATLTDFTTWQPFTAIHAFDGDRYQLLYQPEQPPQPVLMPDRPYVVIDPLTSIYGFALGEGMEASLRTLRDEVFWSRLEGMVLGCEAARVNDTDGIRLRLNVPDKVGEGDIPLELFFPAETGYVPAASCRAVRRGPETGGKEIVSEFRIVATAPVETKVGTIYVPTRLEGDSYPKGGAFEPHTIIEIDPSTLRVNHDVQDSVFTVAGARVYRTATGTPPEQDPRIALKLLDAIHADSPDQLEQVFHPLLRAVIERMPDWMRAGTPELLKDRFGNVQGVEFLRLGEPDNPMVRESMWTVRADGRDFRMKLWFVEGLVSGVFFRHTDEQEWSDYPRLGVEYAADQKIPLGW